MNSSSLWSPTPLQCHPSTPCSVELALHVRAERLQGPAEAAWKVHFELEGDVHRVRLPAAAHPGPRDELWKHTCFEVFAAAEHGTHYEEFNFSPSGEWAHYAFERERVRRPIAPPTIPLESQTARQTGRLTVHAHLPAPTGPCVCGLSAVIELDDGSHSYWALRHPRPRPDFHCRDGWTLLLPRG